ncbi:STAS domain-containing protein [Nonomuraea sp. NN258]|nr:STAS domain-containing protein [Nonomuraea antri]
MSGELDLASAVEVRRAVAQALTPMPARPSLVVLDLKDVAFCDSSGLSLLLAAAETVSAAGARLALGAVGPRLTRVLTITGLCRRFLIYDSVADAMAFLARPGNAETAAWC